MTSAEQAIRETPDADHEILTDAELGEARQQSAALQEKARSWRSDTFLFFCRILSLVTAGSALLCMLVHIAALVRAWKGEPDVFEFLLRIYAVFFAGFAAIAETEWDSIFKFWRVLEYWVGRGVFLTFVAVMTKALSHSSRDGSFEATIHVVASWMLLSCGLFYFIMGILCFGKLKRNRLAKAQRLENALKDLQEIEKRKKELEGLLANRG